MDYRASLPRVDNLALPMDPAAHSPRGISARVTPGVPNGYESGQQSGSDLLRQVVSQVRADALVMGPERVGPDQQLDRPEQDALGQAEQGRGAFAHLSRKHRVWRRQRESLRGETSELLYCYVEYLPNVTKEALDGRRNRGFLWPPGSE